VTVSLDRRMSESGICSEPGVLVDFDASPAVSTSKEERPRCWVRVWRLRDV
jgi:hypothetical protein